MSKPLSIIFVALLQTQNFVGYGVFRGQITNWKPAPDKQRIRDDNRSFAGGIFGSFAGGIFEIEYTDGDTEEMTYSQVMKWLEAKEEEDESAKAEATRVDEAERLRAKAEAERLRAKSEAGPSSDSGTWSAAMIQSQEKLSKEIAQQQTTSMVKPYGTSLTDQSSLGHAFGQRSAIVARGAKTTQKQEQEREQEDGITPRQHNQDDNNTAAAQRKQAESDLGIARQLQHEGTHNLREAAKLARPKRGQQPGQRTELRAELDFYRARRRAAAPPARLLAGRVQRYTRGAA